MVLDSVTVCRKMSVCNAGHGMGWDGTSYDFPNLFFPNVPER